MFKFLLISLVLVPVLLGMKASSTRREMPGLQRLLLFLLAYDVFYLVLLYYLRLRWVG